MFSNSTPLSELTVGDLLSILGRPAMPEQATMQQDPNREYVFGIAGIAGLLGCSIVTAQRYKNTFLTDGGAILQNGRKIICDAALARELFNQHKAEQ